MENTLPQGKQKHIYGLDYIRAISAVFIVLFHYTTQYNVSIGHEGKWMVMVPWGSRAVYTFFLLTGYLTVRNYRDGGLHFAAKRLIRLWPAFAASVIITSVCMALLMPERLRTMGEILLNFTMFPTYLGARAVDGVYWTLAIEIIFYFWIMLVMLSKKSRYVVLSLYGWSVFSLAVNLCAKTSFAQMPVNLAKILCITNYAPAFILGITIHFFQENDGANWKQVTPLALLSVAGLWAGLGTAIAVWSVGWAVLIWVVSSGKLKFTLGKESYIHKCLCFLAKISYTLYLLHQFIGFAIIRRIEQWGGHSEWWIFVPMAISILLAAGVHYLVEAPVGDFLVKKLVKKSAKAD